MPGDHFYTTDPNGEYAPARGYKFEVIAGYVHTRRLHPGEDDDTQRRHIRTYNPTVPIYRWFQPSSDDHFYAVDPNNEDIRNYRNDHVRVYVVDKAGGPPKDDYQSRKEVWYMYQFPKTGTVPLCRWFNPKSGDHFYTTDPKGEHAPTEGYKFECITGYLYPSPVDDTVPLYRWFLGSHRQVDGERKGHGAVIPDSYIVTINPSYTAESFRTMFNNILRELNGESGDSKICEEYTAIPGFHVRLNKVMYDRIKSAPEVAEIEQDRVIKVAAVQTHSPPCHPRWGLIRISEKVLDLNQPYRYPNSAGEGVTAYVIDTGVFIEHDDFEGRASLGANCVSGSTNTDEHGHGTHVAAIIGGATYGVAKKVRIVGVKVFDHSGEGSITSAIGGLSWVAIYAARGGRSLVNMSFVVGKSNYMNSLVEDLFNKNIPSFVAAGNDPGQNVPDVSPAGAPCAITVAATDKTDHAYRYNSCGAAVDILAPGVDIDSAWISNQNEHKVLTGTSMAASHVAGVAALYLSRKNMTPANLLRMLITTATSAAIKGDLRGSPNLIVFNGAMKKKKKKKKKNGAIEAQTL